MVAYSFQERFREAILAGRKCQTIRADRQRHARPGEELQLYTGMRTRQCALIGRATCLAASSIRMDFIDGVVKVRGMRLAGGSLDQFARLDGFTDWQALALFWRQEHGESDGFAGVLIVWGQLHPASERVL